MKGENENGKIFKQLARHWAACLAVVALLFVQAYCDLSLPDYTSRIVDSASSRAALKAPCRRLCAKVHWMPSRF